MLNRLRQSLSKTTAALGGALSGLFTRKLDEALLQEIEDALVSTDFGVETSAQVISLLRDRCHKAGRAGAEQWPQQLQELLQEMVQPCVGSLAIPASPRPYCILVVGVNGSGKTTTLAKLAHHYQASGHRPLLVAGDTFRAAAVEQLGSWAQRLNCPIITGAHGGDPAALAYQAWQQASQQGNDVLLIDTAGRLPNKPNLMAELQKLPRVLEKLDVTAPQQRWLVLDGTTGQHALRQVELFQQAMPLTGLIVSKLDGSSKGGMIVALAASFKLPIIALGTGEQLDDLQPFVAEDFAASVLPEMGSVEVG
jgi:fused signal recognition particle receptor